MLIFLVIISISIFFWSCSKKEKNEEIILAEEEEEELPSCVDYTSVDPNNLESYWELFVEDVIFSTNEQNGFWGDDDNRNRQMEFHRCRFISNDLDGVDIRARKRAPLVGENNFDILQEIGFSDAEIADLAEQGIFTEGESHGS